MTHRRIDWTIVALLFIAIVATISASAIPNWIRYLGQIAASTALASVGVMILLRAGLLSFGQSLFYRQIQILNATNSREIDAAFAALVRERADALFVSPGGLFNGRRVQLGTMAARHAVPMTSATREIAEAGGLMSYGPNLADAWRVVGVYAGRVLKGAKPRDLPVEQVSKFELIINAQTARMLNLEVPPTLLARADEVIE